ncbi:MAG: glycine hydroxymethyltransferase [Parachlamydiales bacterium]|nr:glycine hydroxymethyltransferase [Parachlamydiales bacterium]
MSDSILRRYLNQTPENKQKSETIALLASLESIQKSYPEIASSIIQELKDQRSSLKLIASENYCSLPVQLCMGNWLTDKYAEGHVQHRFYAGCENVDSIEENANLQAKKLFNAQHAFVQPHSGADANFIAFWAVLIQRVQNKEVEKLGKKSIDDCTPEEHESIRKVLMDQKILGMSLNSGGHLTHGYRHNFSSKMFQSFCYDVDKETGLLNYDDIARLAKESRPIILLAGYSAYSRRINFAKMREIADSVGAVLMVDMAHFAGLVAGGVFTGEENPVPYAHILTSTTHKTLRGPRGGLILCTEEFKDIINKACPLAMGGPLPQVMAAKAIAFKEANTKEFKEYAQRIVDNSRTLANALIQKGVRVLTGGTDNHLLVFDVSPFNLTGRQVEIALREANLTSSRNAIPFDPNGPWYTSGIRIGTAALTTLGMGSKEMETIADLILKILQNTTASKTESGAISKAKSTTDPAIKTQVREMVASLLKSFPLYPDIPVEF